MRMYEIIFSSKERICIVANNAKEALKEVKANYFNFFGNLELPKLIAIIEVA